VTASGALAGTKVSVCNTLGCASDSATRLGWTVGAGLEYALVGNWTLKAEYLFSSAMEQLPTQSCSHLARGFTVVTRDLAIFDSIARVGINYKFDAPVASRGY
jgi:outer membrane immunogenic protein